MILTFRSGRTYRQLFAPGLDVLPLGLGKVIPNLLVAAGTEERVYLPDCSNKHNWVFGLAGPAYAHLLGLSQDFWLGEKHRRMVFGFIKKSTWTLCGSYRNFTLCYCTVNIGLVFKRPPVLWIRNFLPDRFGSGSEPFVCICILNYINKIYNKKY
jgi:hypothetical protein